MASHARVVFLAEAVAEAREAYSWYEQRNPRAADAFFGEVDRAVARVIESPGTWPRSTLGTRRCLFERFPFYLVYRELEDHIEILAVAHAKRRPGYWKDR